MSNKFYIWLGSRPWLAFILFNLSFIAFGMLSLDLIRIFLANAEYLSSNGWQGLADGGLRQLIELCVKAIIAMSLYLLFKICETILIQRICRKN